MKYLIIIFILVFISPCYAGILFEDSCYNLYSETNYYYLNNLRNVGTALSLIYGIRFKVDVDTAITGDTFLFGMYDYNGSNTKIYLTTDSYVYGAGYVKFGNYDNTSHNFYSTFKITYGKWHTICVYSYLDSGNLYTRLYFDNETPQDFSSSWSRGTVLGSNIKRHYFNGTSGSTLTTTFGEFFILSVYDSVNMNYADSISSIFNASFLGSTLFSAKQKDPIKGNSNNFECWNQNFKNGDSITNYSSANGFLDEFGYIKDALTKYRIWYGTSITATRHPGYYTNTLKRRR
jgi:hypothetical protein